MNFDSLSIVEWGNAESLREFTFENEVQHKLFWETLVDSGIIVPRYPLSDLVVDNIDDWLQIHQSEHQAFAAALSLDNPFNLLDTDWRIEADFYDWIATHLAIHQKIASTLGL